MRFRKKPVVIEATQWFKDGDHPAIFIFEGSSQVWVKGHAYIETLEGRHLVTPGDWIITGVKGEYYACKPDIFVMTYEQADAAVAADRAQHGWISVDEKSPPSGNDVVIALSTGSVVVGMRWSGNAWDWAEADDDEDLDAHVTHWIPLPSAPIAAQQKGDE